MQTAIRLKQGTIRADGMVFWRYSARCINGEYWVSKEKFLELRHSNTKAHGKWMEKNRDREKNRSRLYRELNPNKRLASLRRWQKANPEKVLAAVRRYQKANPHKVSALHARRRALISGLAASLSKREAATIASFYEARKRISECMGIQFHVDHIMPLSKGGLHAPSNLQILPARINLRKNAKLDFTIPHHD